LKTFTKESLKRELLEIAERGFVPSPKNTKTTRNDGAAGNLLEQLLGIEENNLPLPNAAEWELKVQRAHTASNLTLFHMEPSPTAMRFVPQILLPYYGWPHAEAGGRHSENERSFRMTMTGKNFTDRGFKVIADGEKVKVVFDSSQVSERHSEWLQSVERNVGLGELDPAPYWGYEDLKKKISSKLQNTFYVTAEVKKIDGQEYFHFFRCEMLRGFALEGFLDLLEKGEAIVEFDARTGHNHGTKFRVKQLGLPKLYKDHDLVFDLNS
jgi:hypothetical protein